MKIMRKYFAALILLAACIGASAADYAKYYENTPVKLAQVTSIFFPDRSVDIVTYGAVGDAVTLCTDAIQKAIDEVAALGGGRVLIPEGIWLTGPIELKSNVNLELQRNAILYFSPDKALYVESEKRSSRVKPCITANKCKNIGITGEGTIDGNGAQWRPVKRGKVSDVEWSQFKRMGGVERAEGTLWYPWEMKNGSADIAPTPEKQEKMRNDLFRVYYCENILLQGVTFQNAPKFHVHPFNSQNVIIDGITVRCPWNAQNGDAIDISDCHRVLIVNSVVDAGDDGICLKSGDAKKDTDINGCRDIMICDNTVYHAHGGFVIGSEDICGMERIVVRDCTFSGTDTGLRFKSGPGRGGRTDKIYIDRIMMTDITGQAIVFQCDYADRPAGSKDVVLPPPTEKVPEFNGIEISGVVCRGCRVGISAKGIEGLDCVHNIKITNSTIYYTQTATDIDQATTQITIKGVKLVGE